MAATGKTEHYELPIFEGNDHAEWLVDWNNCMNTIDTIAYNMQEGQDNITTQINTINENIETVNNDMSDMRESFTYYDSFADQIANLEATQANFYAALESINTRLDGVEDDPTPTVEAFTDNCFTAYGSPSTSGGSWSYSGSNATLTASLPYNTSSDSVKSYTAIATYTVNKQVQNATLLHGALSLWISDSTVGNVTMSGMTIRVTYSDGVNSDLYYTGGKNGWSHAAGSLALRDGIVNTIQIIMSGLVYSNRNAYTSRLAFASLQLTCLGSSPS